MVLIGGNRDSFRHRASKYEYALGLSLCLVVFERTEKYSFRKRGGCVTEPRAGTPVINSGKISVTHSVFHTHLHLVFYTLHTNRLLLKLEATLHKIVD